MLLLSGGLDTTAVPATNQQPVFADGNGPILWATLKDATHAVPATGDSGAFRPMITAWFLWQLAGDKTAAALFRDGKSGYGASPDWTVQRKNGG